MQALKKCSILLLFAASLVVSCKKQDVDTRISSIWYINDQQFKSANVRLFYTGGYHSEGWECVNDTGTVLFHFILAAPFYEQRGRFSTDPGISWSTCVFYYQGRSYMAPYDSYIPFEWVTSPNPQFWIDTAWVYNYEPGTRRKLDSVKLRGAFSGPNQTN